jgi:sugar/nucleoside kinase (ribokinase family)
VTSNEPDELPDLLESVDYQFAGLFALVEPDDATVPAIINEARSRKQRIKLVLKFAGCSPDEVNSQWLADADLVLGNDAPETDVLAGLKKLFEQKS